MGIIVPSLLSQLNPAEKLPPKLHRLGNPFVVLARVIATQADIRILLWHPLRPKNTWIQRTFDRPPMMQWYVLDVTVTLAPGRSTWACFVVPFPCISNTPRIIDRRLDRSIPRLLPIKFADLERNKVATLNTTLTSKSMNICKRQTLPAGPCHLTIVQISCFTREHPNPMACWSAIPLPSTRTQAWRASRNCTM